MSQKLLTYKDDQRVPEDLLYYRQFWKDILHTGSRVICNPPPQDTDDDWLLLTTEEMFSPLEGFLIRGGFQLGGSSRHTLQYHYNGIEIAELKGPQEEFHSLKRQDLNVILTSKPDFFESFRRATEIARSLNILEKPVRIGVFKAVRSGDYPESFEDQQKFLASLREKHNDVSRRSENKQMDGYTKFIVSAIPGGFRPAVFNPAAGHWVVND